MYCSAFQAIGHSGTTTIRKASVKRGKHQRQRNFIRGLLTDGALDQRDHAVEEGLTRKRRDLDHDPIRDDPRAASNARAIAARLADDRRGFAGDRGFVHRRDPFDDFAVAGNHLPCRYDDAVARSQIGRQDFLEATAGSIEAIGGRLAARLAQRFGLRLAARFRERGREIREQHGQEKPKIQRDEIGNRNLARRCTHQRLHDEQQREHSADLHHEHHRIASTEYPGEASRRTASRHRAPAPRFE